MKKTWKKQAANVLCLLLLICFFSACNAVQEEISEVQEVVKVMPGAYDSVDTAMVVGKNKDKKTITFLNLAKKKNYTLSYDGTTGFFDKYETGMSAEQLEKGEVVEIQFLKGQKLLSRAQISPNIWSLREVTDFELDLKAGRMKILGEYYTLHENTIILSEDQQAEYLDIHPQDTLWVRGQDQDIYSITIENGHGYLRLQNAEYFVGGWIEVGGRLIREVEQEMLLAVTEGNHKVYVSNTGIEGEKQVEIKRGKETTLDLGDLKKDDMIKYGNLIFTVEPSTAKVYIDGKEVDISRTIKAEYGLHQIMATAEGHETVIQYLRVSGEGASVAISLEEEKERTLSGNNTGTGTITPTPLPTVSGNKTVSGNSGSSSSTASGNSISTTGYKVEINAPAGAEVYVDGNYMGIVPTSFKKVRGNYQITLRKAGYETATYKIEVGEENKDRPFSFSELVPLN